MTQQKTRFGYFRQQENTLFVIFSACSYEAWRPDAHLFSEQDIGSPLDDWADEQWLDIRSKAIHAIMTQRLDLAQQKGCDGVEPDNMEAISTTPVSA